jgi:hypothetical protein
VVTAGIINYAKILNCRLMASLGGLMKIKMPPEILKASFKINRAWLSYLK